MRKSSAIELLRRLSGDLWNVAVDEYVEGYLNRRDLIRYASLIGLTSFAASRNFGLIGEARAQGTPGGTIRVGVDAPSGAIDPVTVTSPPAITVLSQVGEYLVFDDADKGLVPSLALSWEANDEADVWTFKLRPGVKFHDGRVMSAKDVVASFDRLVDPNGPSSALSAYKGLLSKGAIKAVDDMTVSFTLDAPNGNFPFYVSSDVVNCIIIPADFSGNYDSSFIGTGPFKLESFRPKKGVSFVRNEDYWGEKALPDRVEITFFDDYQAILLAMQAGQIDIMPYTPRLAPALDHNPTLKILTIPSSAYDEVHLRVDQAPFTDKRVRRAMALTIDREAVTKGLLKDRASPANDHPFSPIFPSSVEMPQRKQDISEAKRLLAEAGVPNGFQVTLTTEQAYSLPDYAVLLQNFAKLAGIDIKLNVEPQDAYYGEAVYGKSDWLDSVMGLTDYGHRGTPDIFLNATLRSTGTWNAAHFNSPAYDALVSQYAASRDLTSQRQAATKIQEMLMDETPVIIAYFSKFCLVTGAKVQGARFTAISHVLLDRATIA
jgi:peptide/nickel transport system substrate-binding protein